MAIGRKFKPLMVWLVMLREMCVQVDDFESPLCCLVYKISAHPTEVRVGGELKQ